MLHTASEMGNASVVNLLLENGADPDGDFPQPYETPLHLAYANGHIDVMVELINSKADVNAKFNGSTVLHLASTTGQTNVVELLLEETWESVDTEAEDAEGRTALQLARTNDHDDVVVLLLAYGACDDEVDEEEDDEEEEADDDDDDDEEDDEEDDDDDPFRRLWACAERRLFRW